MDNLNVVKQINIGDKLYDLNSKYWGGLEPTDKQDTLISGSNIKTINGQSILGEGDITISGGSSNANVQAVDTQETIDDVYDGGVVKYTAQSLTDEQKSQVRQNIGLDNIINSVKLNGTTYTPTNGEVDLGNVSGGGSGIEWLPAPFIQASDIYRIQFNISNPLLPNKVYILYNNVFNEITFDEIQEENAYGDIYTIIAKTHPSYSASMYFPSNVIFANGVEPTIENDTIYEISMERVLVDNTQYYLTIVTPFS